MTIKTNNFQILPNILLIVSLLFSLSLHGQDTLVKRDSTQVPIYLTKDAWVDSIIANMSQEEKIGQLFMIRAHSNKTAAYHEVVRQQIKKYHVGGLCFFQGGPKRQLNLIKSYAKESKTPMLIAIDGEWGIGMRLDSVRDFPRQMTLGATADTNLLYEIGLAFGRQCKEVGLNVNFAPVADVNNNPQNPVINSRSFGENPDLVASYAWQIAKGMQDEGVMACAKHFPGHGDTHSDSHKTLPTINGNLKELDSIHVFYL
jgi:beta-N-acetylhexosaminidase